MTDYNPWNSQPDTSRSGGSYAAQPSSAAYPEQNSQSAYPASQSSAYPASQSSAYPASQSSAYSAEADYPTNQSSAVYGRYSEATAQLPQQPSGYAVSEQPVGTGNNIAALFDFGFKKFATRSIVKASYILTFILAILWWLGPMLGWFVLGAGVEGASGGSSGGGMPFVVMGFLQLILGWIPSLLMLIFARMVCEFFVLQQQAAESLRKLEDK